MNTNQKWIIIKESFKKSSLFILFSSFITHLCLAHPLKLNEEIYDTSKQLHNVLNLIEKIKKNSPSELEIYLKYKEKLEIYSTLLESLRENQYESIDSEIKIKILKILNNNYLRKSYNDNSKKFISVFHTLSSIQSNQNFNCPTRPVFDSSKNRIGSIYFIDQLKDSYLPSIFFRTKDIENNEDNQKPIFIKQSGTTKSVKMVIGYPDMNVYALSTPSLKHIKNYFNNNPGSGNVTSQNIEMYKLFSVNSFLKEKQVFDYIFNSPQLSEVQYGIQEILFSGFWNANSSKISETYVTIQPFYEGESLIEFSNFLESKLNSQSSFEDYQNKFLENYFTMIQLLKVTAQNFHKLDLIYKLIHKDIKPDNIFVDRRNGTNHPRIADFENASGYTNEEQIIEFHHRPDKYMAFECKKNDFFPCAKALKKNDIYSFGMTLLTLLKNYFQPGYSSDKKLFQNISLSYQNFEISNLKKTYPFYYLLLELIDQTLHLRPEERPSFDQIAKTLERIENQNAHPFFIEKLKYNSSEATYNLLISMVSDYKKFSFQQKPLIEWKEIFTYDSTSSCIYIHIPQSDSKKIIYVNPKDIQSIFDELDFLHQLGRFKKIN